MKISDIDIFVSRPKEDEPEETEKELETIYLEITASERDMLEALLSDKRRELNRVLSHQNPRQSTRSRLTRERQIVHSLLDKLK